MLDLTLPGNIILLNGGDGDVLIQRFRWAGNVNGQNVDSVTQINELLPIEPGFHTIDLKIKSKIQDRAHYLLLDAVPEQSRSAILTAARSGTNQCYELEISLAKEPNMVRTEIAIKREHWSIPLEGTIYFYSFHEKTVLDKKIPLVGLVVRSDKAECLKT